ncbi:hypothetical protein L9F63_002309, partial [Diploptera punctata]
MQWIILKSGWILRVFMDTTVCESVNASASIFLSLSQTPLLFKPLIKDLTKSELHAVMTAGFATVSGSVMAAYMSYGIQPVHILTASVMSAPAALCISKIIYPETKESVTTIDKIQIIKGDERSVLDAGIKGALLGIHLVLGVIANLIAFISFVKFLNGSIIWLGKLVKLEDFDLEFIFSKIFIPLAWLMGVESEECPEVARLVGLKTVVNEFVAYRELGISKKAGLLSPRNDACLADKQKELTDSTANEQPHRFVFLRAVFLIMSVKAFPVVGFFGLSSMLTSRESQLFGSTSSYWLLIAATHVTDKNLCFHGLGHLQQPWGFDFWTGDVP